MVSVKTIGRNLSRGLIGDFNDEKHKPEIAYKTRSNDLLTNFIDPLYCKTYIA